MANFLDGTGLARFWGDVKIFLQSRTAITLDDADKLMVFDDSVKEDINGVSGTYGTLKNLTIGNLKTYLASYFAPYSTADAMIYKGALDCSTNPNFPAANAGDTYKISVAGKIGGASGVSVEIGDMVICTTDGTAAGTQATVGTNWNVIQTNTSGVVTDVGAAIHAATAKTSPVDADEFGFSDSEASWVLKKLTWANLKTALGSIFAAASHTHGSYNRASSVLSGANVFSDVVVSNGIVTNTATRALTAADVGAAASGHNHSGVYEPVVTAITNATIDGIVV